MEIVQSLVKKIAVLVPILLVLYVLSWIANKFIPESFFKNYFVTRDILPPPANVKEWESPKVDTPSGNLETQYVTSYREPLLSYYSNTNLNSNYIRNVNIKKYSNVYSGMIIRGEVKRSFFELGAFPVFVENMQKNRSFTQARALEPWQNTEWVKFEAILGKNPSKGQCNLVFKNANSAGNARFDIYTSLPVYCI